MNKMLNKESYEYKISIIVPCYNTKPWLDECLQSLVNQTLQEIEIICVNDGSTDGTGKRLDEWQAQYPDKIKVIHQTNGGLSNARNTGIKIAQGECIGFVDSDDFVDSTMYEKLYKVLKYKNADCAKCNFLYFNDGEYTKQQTKKSSSIETKALKEDIYTSIFKNGCFFACGYLLKKSFLTTNDITFKDDIRYMEDYIFSYNMIACNPKVFKIEKQLYYYRTQRQEQLTSKKDKTLYDCFKVFIYLQNKINKDNLDNIILKNILLKHKISLLFIFTLNIQYKYKKDFLFKASNLIFKNNKVSTIYKTVLLSRYIKISSQFMAPMAVILFHGCYLWQKLPFIKSRYYVSSD